VTPLSDDLCLVQTVDFFTPIVDSPYWFGQIAAANALSDIYAMGATPLTAMNLVAWPTNLGMAPLAEVLRGGAEKIAEAGAELAGGHSIDDLEPKYGLAVTGLARPEEIVYNAGARPGDKLVLTKRLGIGVLATALKRGLLSEDDMGAAIEEAAALNDTAAAAMAHVEAHACTDVSGFGLAGHLCEMLDASQVSATIFAASLPVHDRTYELLQQGVYAGGLRSNRDYLLPRVHLADLDTPQADDYSRSLILFDPQTSGGLLIAVSRREHEALLEELDSRGARGWTIGEITEDAPGTLTLLESRGAEPTAPSV
jgi:selenide,water dikinase